jgi:hypothetical protein
MVLLINEADICTNPELPADEICSAPKLSTGEFTPDFELEDQGSLEAKALHLWDQRDPATSVSGPVQ